MLCCYLLHRFQIEKEWARKRIKPLRLELRKANELLKVNFQTRKLQNIYLVLNTKFYSQNCD